MRIHISFRMSLRTRVLWPWQAERLQGTACLASLSLGPRAMEEVLWQVGPDAGVASASLVGGSLAKVMDGLGAAVTGVSSVAVGAVSAATGALAAKAFTERQEALWVAKRLQEVKRPLAATKRPYLGPI